MMLHWDNEYMAMITVWILLSYLLGSIPVGLLLSRLKGRDPRKVGSGNIGATNVMRTAGKTMGIVTLLGDAMKGFLPTWLAIKWGLPAPVVAAAGLAAFLGHLFPVYLRFKGGKGIATSVGIFLALSPVALLVVIIIFAGLLAIWRYVSLGSLVGAALMPCLLLFLKAPVEYVFLCIIIAVLIFVKHWDNIRRLRAGTENRIFRGGSKPS